MFFSSFDLSEYGFRPMSINAIECSVPTVAAVAANAASAPTNLRGTQTARSALEIRYSTVLYVRLALCWTAKNCTAKAWRTGLRHCLVLATATPTLAALRPAHDHARAEHTRHARTTRARLASDAHAFTLQQALARQKQGWHARVTGHWLTVGLPTACASGSHTRCKCARHLRCSCGACVAHTLCMPCTTTVVTCAER